MAKTCWRNKQKATPKFSSRKYNRCKITGRRRAYYNRFGLSRMQFREMALKGEIPGVVKASW
jgi:small subunit ribosomal protein S14